MELKPHEEITLYNGFFGVSNSYSNLDLCSLTLGDNLRSDEGEVWNGFLGREVLNGYWWRENERRLKKIRTCSRCVCASKWEVTALLLAYGKLCFSGLFDGRIWKRGKRKWMRVATINPLCSVSGVDSTILAKSGLKNWDMWLGFVIK